MGTVVVSIDAELGWGHHDFAVPPEERVERARDGWEQLLDLLDTFEIPATWAVVGHLFLQDCDRRHDDVPAPEGWFRREREEWADRPDLRFADGLIADIADADAGHEIACHSFSHAVFDDPSVSREFLEAELAASLDAAWDRGFRLSSFVFPRNRVGHRDLLAKYGFSCYRGVCPDRRSTLPGEYAARKVARSVLPGRTPRLAEPYVDEYGLMNVPASQYVFGFEGLPRTVASTVFADPMVRLARRGIEAASTSEKVFHLWLHPNNIVSESDRSRMESILSHLDYRSQNGPLEVKTMHEVAVEHAPSTCEAEAMPAASRSTRLS